MRTRLYTSSLDGVIFTCQSWKKQNQIRTQLYCYHMITTHIMVRSSEMYTKLWLVCSLPLSVSKTLIKGKAVPLQAWSGPEGSRKLRFPDFVTTAQDDGKVVSLTDRPLFTPRKYSWYSFLLEAESTSARSEGFYVNEKSTDTSWDGTSDLPICSTAP